MSEPSADRRARWLFSLIVIVYLILGALYALLTPAWQAPDEPAHYNYVQYLANHHRFPILKPGDYPAAYLEEIKFAHFSPELSIAPIRYEFHQPPLYYLLSVPVYSLFHSLGMAIALLPLRLLSVAMGALLLLVVRWTVQALAPNRPYLALGTTAFVAFLPMHLAMTASVNNDILSELLLALILLLSIRYLRRSIAGPSDRGDTSLLLLLGITTGLCLITKSSLYIVLPLVLIVIAIRHFWLDRPMPLMLSTIKAAILVLLPAIGLAFPWWLRNIAVYGGLDFLGLGRHDQVVVGQLRTAEFLAMHGPVELVRAFLLTSFRSFWGQFGWMGVLLDERLYQAMAILSALALIGFLMWLVRAWQRSAQIATWQWAAGGLLALTGLLTLATYFWYNIDFVQHQGRYLFRALVPIGLAVALGWRETLRRERAWPVAALLLIAALGLRLTGLLPNWPLLMLAVTVVGLVLRRFLSQSWDPVVQVVPYITLVLLALISLFLFIIPQLVG